MWLVGIGLSMMFLAWLGILIMFILDGTWGGVFTQLGLTGLITLVIGLDGRKEETE